MTSKANWKLDFAASRSAAQRALGRRMELLHPMVATGHDLLRDCAGVCRDDVDHAVAASFRQCLEFVDGVDILLRHLVIVPAIAQARSAVETAGYTVYLARQRDAVVAAAYLYSGMRHAENERARKMDSPHLDEEDRRAFQGQKDELDAFQAQSTDYPTRTAIAALQALRRRAPWYSIPGGPRHFRELLERSDAAVLAGVYSDLNPAVHEGMPQMGFHGADGGPGDPTGREWLRPLRVPSPWSFRPVLAAGVAAKVAVVVTLEHFMARLPDWHSRMDAFAVRHNKRCRDCGMQALAV